MEKTHDTLGRKRRDTKQEEDNYPLRLVPKDIETFSYLHRHGGRLPTSYILGHRGGNKQTVQDRLKNLARAGFIARDEEQFATRHPERNELVHEITEDAEELLRERGLYSDLAPTMFGAFKHQVYLSCVSASVELNARENNIPYTPQHKVLERGGSLKVQSPYGKFNIDLVYELFDKPLLVFTEIDRATERVRTKKIDQDRKNWTNSIKQYQWFIGTGEYKKHFKTEHRAVLQILTVSQARQDTILSEIGELMPNGCNYIWIHNFPEFGKLFHPPQTLDILGISWNRHGYPPMKLVNTNAGV